MKLFLKTLLRLGLVATIFATSSLVYKRYFFEGFLKEEGILLYRLQRSLNADYLYFSASSDYTFNPKTDKDTTRVSIIAMRYCNKNIKSIADGAHDVEIFKELVKHIPPNSVEGIIMSFNLRSFSPEWMTSTNLNIRRKLSATYKPNPPLITRFFVSLKNYPIHTNKELKRFEADYFQNWQLPYPFPKNTIQNWCEQYKFGDWTHPKRNLADHYIKSYGFVINENHPRIKDFDEVVQLAHAKKLKLIFHVLPENKEEAQALLGSELTNLIKMNRDFAIDRYHNPKQKVWVVDNLEKVSDKSFIDRDFPTEHYDFEGRDIIAKGIAEQLNKIE